MPLKMRLQRRGKKGKAFYHIVIADGRAPRDGKFIEKIGTYNPITIPADIHIDRDKALDWLNKGALPTDTVRAILSYTGVLYKNHLLKGVRKGAITEEQADVKFGDWLKAKSEKIQKKRTSKELELKNADKKRIETESKINEARAAVIAKKKAREIEDKVRELKAEAVTEAPQTEIEMRDPIPVPVESPPDINTEAAAETPATEAPVTEEDVADEAAAENPVADEPAADEQE